MKKQLLKKTLAASLAVMMLSSTAVVSQTAGFLSVTASAVTGAAAETLDSGSCGELATYRLDSEGTLTISGRGAVNESAFAGTNYALANKVTSIVFAEGSEITDIGAYAFCGLPNLASVTVSETVASIADSAFGECNALTAVTIASTFVKLHPDAFRDSPNIETLAFTAFDGATIQGALYGLPETAQVTMTPFSKIYTPAQKYLYGPAIAYDTYRPAYAHAILYWEDTEPILEAAAADGVSIRDSKETLAWISNDNISTYFPNTQCGIVGTMEGDGSFAYPLQIWNADNWRYLDYLARLGQLTGSYYGWDRGTNVKLMADLTLSDKDGTFTTIGGGKHKEVHNNSYAYFGNFDGNGHTITLDVSDSIDDGEEGFGLFAKTDGAYIKNLHISGRMVSSEIYTGLLIGKSATDWIYNCSSDAELVLKGSGERRSGSFVGYSYHTSLENCHFTGKITGGSEITGVGGFVGYINGSNASSRTMKNCYFAPSEIDVNSAGSCMLYRPYYSSYSGFVGYETLENNYHNAEAEKLNGDNMGDLDQGQSDAQGVDSLNETEFWADGEITMPKATVKANPGTRRFVYTGGEHRIFMDLQADAYNGGGSILARGESFPYMPGYAKNGIAYYKVNDGEWSATPPVATNVGEYTVYYCAVGDAYHSTSDIQSIQVTIEEAQELPGSGTPADPYTISNELEWSIFCDMRDTKDKYFKLVNDIVVSEDRQNNRGPNHPLTFNGVFDGDGHTITWYLVSRHYSDSLFGRVVGHSDYYENGGWHYWHATIKNLIVEGVMYGDGDLAPVAQSLENGGTISNVISNMTIVNIGAGGDTDVSGIACTGRLTGSPEFHNIKVGGIFSAMGGNKGFEGITFMDDFWQSGTGFLIKDCYVNPTCEDIKVSSNNYVIMGNYVEGKSAIENTFFGQSILSIIPVDEETGETTNTQGISDENGLDALEATGYWADGNPTMPQAAFTVMPIGDKTFIYREEENIVVDPDTEEEQAVMVPVEYELITPGETEDGTVWYRLDGGVWSTDVPTAAGAGRHTVECKIVGDYLHRDSETVTVYSYITYEWTIPTGLTVTSVTMPYEDYGRFTSDTNAKIRVEWDDNLTNSDRFTMTIISPDGQSGAYFADAPVGHDAWYELGGEKPAARFFVGLLGDNEEQIFENGTVNGAKYGDTVVITAKGVIMIDGNDIESPACQGVDFAAGISNIGKTFPVLDNEMSNDTGMKSNVIVLGDKAVIDCLASGGKAPYQYEVTYRAKDTDSYLVAQTYQANGVVSLTPKTAGIYEIHVNAKDTEGTVVGKDFTLTVNKVLANLSELSENTIVLGESVTVAAKSEGGMEPRTYRVTCQANGSDKEILVQDYAVNDTITFTPEQAGAYTITVEVKDSRNVVVSKTFALTVNKPLENHSSVSADLILLGDSLTINAEAEGGLSPVQYEIAVKAKEAEDYTVISDYTDEKTLTMVCDTEGEFVFRVNVKDSRGTVVSKEMPVKVHNTLTNFSTLSDDEIVLGESVTITAKAKGGKAPYTYAMCYKPADADEYILFRDFSSQAKVVFTPTTDGTCQVLVLVRDSLGVVADKEFTVKVNKNLANTSTLSKKKIVVGNTITVKASAEGGKGTYQYKVSMKKADETAYTLVQGYSENQTVVVKPEEAVNYNIRVAVRDTQGTAVVKVFTVYVYSVLENNAAVSAEVITIGDTVTVQADAVGGQTPYKYEVTYKKATSEKYSTALSYSTKKTVSIKLATAVTYDIHVNVKDALGQVVGKDFTVEVCKPLENTSTLSADTLTLGESVTINGSALGGKAPYLYEITYKKASSSKYTTAQAYKANSTLRLKPGAAVAYDVHINVKDSLGQVVGKDFTVQVYQPLTLTAGVSADTILLGASVHVNAEAAGGKAPYQYQVLYKKATSETYSTAKAYSAANTADITPAGTGAYDIRVNVKDALGNVVSQNLTVTVFNTLKNTSKLSATTVTTDKTVTVTCSSTGGLGTKQYKVTYYDPDTKKWVTVKNYSTANTATLNIGKTGFFTVRTTVKDEAGTEAVKDITLNIYGVLTNTSTISTTTAKLGDTVTVYGSATGAKGAVRYEYTYYNSKTKTWYTAKDYSTDTSAAIKISLPGKYTVRVRCKDTRNTATKKDFTVTVSVS